MKNFLASNCDCAKNDKYEVCVYFSEENLPPLSEPVVHKKCVRFAGEEEEDKKSHLQEKKLKDRYENHL